MDEPIDSPIFICSLATVFGVALTDATGRVWPIEWGPYLGPVVLHKVTGDPLKRQPGPRSPFWHAAQCWIDQGTKVTDGRAVWSEPPPHRVRKLPNGDLEDAGSLPYAGHAERAVVFVEDSHV